MQKRLNITPDHFNQWTKQYVGLNQKNLYSLSTGFNSMKVLGSQLEFRGHFAIAEGCYNQSKQAIFLKITFRKGVWFILLFLTLVGLFFTINIIIDPEVTIQRLEDPPLLIRICTAFITAGVFAIPILPLLRTKKLFWKSIEKSIDKVKAK